MNERDMKLYRYWQPAIKRWGYTYDPNVPNGESLHPASELDQLRQRVGEVEFELDMKTAHYEERIAYTIIHNGVGLLCSEGLYSAYSELRAKLALAEQDARRWQWFRDHGYKLKAPMCYFDISCQPDELDQAIDAAIDASGE